MLVSWRTVGERPGGTIDPDAFADRMERDHRFAAEIALCVEALGIPHSEFLSWPIDDQDVAVAYWQWKRSVCSGCGTRLADWREFAKNPARNEPPFVPEEVICHGCAELERARNEEEQQRGKDVPRPRGQKWRLVPRWVAELVMSQEERSG